VFAAIAKDLATSHKVQLIYCVLACGMISNPLAPTSLMYNTFQRTGVGSLTICAALADVTLTNVEPAGIATAVSPAVTATAELCTHLVAVTFQADTSQIDHSTNRFLVVRVSSTSKLPRIYQCH
jgi:hypothetical protein